ncbi:MAG: hypothetical protein NVS3B2_11870 [Ramlibacter sp.]
MSIIYHRTSQLFVLAVASLAMAGPVFADRGGNGHGHGQGQGNGHSEQRDGDEGPGVHRDRDDVKVGQFFNDGHREAARNYYGEQYNAGRRCPPGLAKKHNGCMPPGQVHYAVGQSLPRTATVYPVPQPVIGQLPVAPPGYRYVRSGNDILLLSPQSQVVVDVIAGLLR